MNFLIKKSGLIPVIFLFLSLITSCLQELEDQPATFIKVLGREAALVTKGQAITKLDNGHLLIYGTGSRYMYNDAEEVYFPFIIETDEFGNEVQYRTYPIFKGEWKMYGSALGLGSNEFDVKMDRQVSGIYEIKHLRNGNFFALGLIDINGLWEITFYVLLDKDLNLIKWNWMTDTDIENPSLCDRWIPTHAPMQDYIVENLSGDILCLISASYCGYWLSYSVIKLNSQAEIIDVWDYFPLPEEMPEYGYVASGWTQADNGNMVVTIRKFPPGSDYENYPMQMVFHELDPNTGEIVRRVEYGKNTWATPWNIFKNDQGFVVQHYTGPKSLNELGGRALSGNLLFLGHDLDSLRSVPLTDQANVEYPSSFAQTMDGGYLSVYILNAAHNYSEILIKTDADGNVLWRLEDQWITGLTEMDDGSIVYVNPDIWNESTNKLVLKKLGPDGKL